MVFRLQCVVGFSVLFPLFFSRFWWCVCLLLLMLFILSGYVLCPCCCVLVPFWGVVVVCFFVCSCVLLCLIGIFALCCFVDYLGVVFVWCRFVFSFVCLLLVVV